MGSSSGEGSHPTSPSRCVISLGNLHFLLSLFFTLSFRVLPLAGETFIQLPSLEQRCMCLVAELIVLGHFIPTTRSTVTALKCLIQKPTRGWTPLPLPCFPRAGGAIQPVSVAVLRVEGGGRKLLPALGGMSALLGGAVGAQSPVSVDSCCPPKSPAHHTVHGGDVRRGGQAAAQCFVFDAGSGTCWVAL